MWHIIYNFREEIQGTGSRSGVVENSAITQSLKVIQI